MTQKLGDVIDQEQEDVIRQWEHLGRRPWIVKPTFNPKAIPGMSGPQAFMDQHAMPRMWQLLADYFELLKKGVFRVQQPGWIQAPITSDHEDLRTDAAVALSNGTPVTVLEYQVPDRHLASFISFGHELTASSEWGVVTWTIQVNKRQIRTYKDFKRQIGFYTAPTPFSKPITLKGKDVIKVIATGGATAVSAYARMPGFVIPATAVTQDGTFRDWNVR
jgi:hypothetical protein